MRACFWIDAGAAVGAGHATRAQALAEALGRYGFHSTLFAEDVGAVRRAGVPPSWIEPLAGRSLAHVCAAQRGSVAIVDLPHTRPATTDALAALVDSGVPIVGFDSSAADPSVFDLWVDLVADRGKPQPAPDRCLRGPRYAVLRAGLCRRDRTSTPRSAARPRLLIGFGAADPAGLTARALWALRGIGDRMSIDVLVGPLVGPRARAAVERAASALPRVTLHRDVFNPVSLLQAANLGLFAFGNLFLEAAACGLASVLWHPTREHADISARFQTHAPQPFAIDLGSACDGTPEALEAAIRALLESPDQRDALSSHASRVVDGRGAERVASAVVARMEGRT